MIPICVFSRRQSRRDPEIDVCRRAVALRREHLNALIVIAMIAHTYLRRRHYVT
jgi:hypothetical protein